MMGVENYAASTVSGKDKKRNASCNVLGGDRKNAFAASSRQNSVRKDYPTGGATETGAVAQPPY